MVLRLGTSPFCFFVVVPSVQHGISQPFVGSYSIGSACNCALGSPVTDEPLPYSTAQIWLELGRPLHLAQLLPGRNTMGDGEKTRVQLSHGDGARTFFPTFVIC